MPNKPETDIDALAAYLHENVAEGREQPELVVDLHGQEIRVEVRDAEFICPVGPNLRSQLSQQSVEEIGSQLSGDYRDGWQRMREAVLEKDFVSLNTLSSALIPMLTDRTSHKISVWRDLQFDVDRLLRSLRGDAQGAIKRAQDLGRLPAKRASAHELAQALGFERQTTTEIPNFWWISHAQNFSDDHGHPGVISKPKYGGKTGETEIENWRNLESFKTGDVVLVRGEGESFNSIAITIGRCEFGTHPFTGKADQLIVPAFYFDFETPLLFEEIPDSWFASFSRVGWKFSYETTRERMEQLWTDFRSHFPQAPHSGGFSEYIGKLREVAFEKGRPLPFQMPRNIEPAVIQTESKRQYPLNLVLYGPPGTGKTYATKELALDACGVSITADTPTERRQAVNSEFERLRNERRVDFVTFHQSFGYEEFVEGIRPVLSNDDESSSHRGAGNGEISYEISDGIFKIMAVAARQVWETDDDPAAFVLLIDEINRGNISKILGELITLLEPTKRLGTPDALEVRLPYSKKLFGVPPNLHVIGTMNTADRSIALLDSALRRRFRFMQKSPDAAELKRVLKRRVEKNPSGLDEIGVDPEEWLLFVTELFRTLNSRILVLHDRDHQIGHTYFLDAISPRKLHDALRLAIVPLLTEYFFGSWSLLASVLGCPYHDGKSARADFENSTPTIVRCTTSNSEMLHWVDGFDPARGHVFEIDSDFEDEQVETGKLLDFCINILSTSRRLHWRRRFLLEQAEEVAQIEKGER